jgi:nucleoside-diphosphate-sugar epimerase
MKCVVTGGAGFIGSHVVNALREAGHDVLVVDVSGQDACNLDICRTELLTDTLGGYGPEVIFHLAAVSDARRALAAPVNAVNINVGGSASVLEAARRVGAKRVVLASTASVCGAMKEGLVDEAEPFLPAGTGHIYSSTKVAAEFLAHDFWQLYDLPFTILRYSATYGPGMWQGLVLRSFLAQAFAGQPIIVYGDGSTSRRFLFVDDVARAHVLALKGAAQNQTYNLQGAREVTIKELAELVSRLLGGVEIEYRQERRKFGDPQYDGRDISCAKAYAELGWEPKVDLEEGVRRTIEWYRANLGRLQTNVP